MRYQDRDTLVNSLREFADFIEKNGVKLPLDKYDIEMKLNPILYDDGDDNTALMQLKRAVKALGKAEKSQDSYYFDVTRKFGCIELQFSINREKVCKRIVVGVKEVPQELIPARLVEAHTEEIVEWQCEDSLLRA
jgi:hypothetical protein